MKQVKLVGLWSSKPLLFRALPWDIEVSVDDATYIPMFNDIIGELEASMHSGKPDSWRGRRKSQ